MTLLHGFSQCLHGFCLVRKSPLVKAQNWEFIKTTLKPCNRAERALTRPRARRISTALGGRPSVYARVEFAANGVVPDYAAYDT